MFCQVLAQRRRNTLIKENPHSRHLQRRRSVLKDHAYLFQRDAGEPLYKLSNLSATFQILK